MGDSRSKSDKGDSVSREERWVYAGEQWLGITLLQSSKYDKCLYKRLQEEPQQKLGHPIHTQSISMELAQAN